jgi:hypothetical protein
MTFPSAGNTLIRQSAARLSKGAHPMQMAPQPGAGIENPRVDKVTIQRSTAFFGVIHAVLPFYEVKPHNRTWTFGTSNISAQWQKSCTSLARLSG